MIFDFNSISKFCINLKRSTDRRENVQKEFDKIGLQVQYFDGVDKLSLNFDTPRREGMSLGQVACMLSHVNLIKYAKANNLPAICIFEDDIIFCDDFNQRIKYIESLKLDFDVFYLGGHFDKMGENAIKTDINYIFKLIQTGGTYAYILTNKTYDYVIDNIEYNKGIYGIDQFYGAKLLREYNSLMMIPCLVSCCKCVSLITDSLWFYENVLWQYQQHTL